MWKRRILSHVAMYYRSRFLMHGKQGLKRFGSTLIGYNYPNAEHHFVPIWRSIKFQEMFSNQDSNSSYSFNPASSSTARPSRSKCNVIAVKENTKISSI